MFCCDLGRDKLRLHNKLICRIRFGFESGKLLLRNELLCGIGFGFESGKLRFSYKLMLFGIGFGI